jgi:predicted secreted protein
MACKKTKIVGRNVILEYSIGCGDRIPSEGEWQRVSAMRNKELSIEWETTDATADDSVGALRENLATYQTMSISGSGTLKVGGAGYAPLLELTKHVISPAATDGQPVAWVRLTFPDLTFTAFMIITNCGRTAPHDNIVEYSFEAQATSSDFGLIVEDTPDVNAPDPTAVEVIPAALTLAAGKAYDVEAVVAPAQANQSVRWESSAPAVASVNLITGVVNANALGTATITAKSVDNPAISDTCAVTVVSNPSAIEVSPAAVSVADGATQQLTASVLPATAPQGLSYITGDPAIATVSASGLVTGVAEGETTITIRSTFAPGVIKTVQVEVTA